MVFNILFTVETPHLPSELSDDKDPNVRSNSLNLNNSWDTFELLSITPVPWCEGLDLNPPDFDK